MHFSRFFPAQTPCAHFSLHKPPVWTPPQPSQRVHTQAQPLIPLSLFPLQVWAIPHPSLTWLHLPGSSDVPATAGWIRNASTSVTWTSSGSTHLGEQELGDDGQGLYLPPGEIWEKGPGALAAPAARCVESLEWDKLCCCSCSQVFVQPQRVVEVKAQGSAFFLCKKSQSNTEVF